MSADDTLVTARGKLDDTRAVAAHQPERFQRDIFEFDACQRQVSIADISQLIEKEKFR
jgi:hypothetical protein